MGKERLVCKHYLYQDGKEYCKKVKTRATCSGMNTLDRCDFPAYRSPMSLLKRNIKKPTPFINLPSSYRDTGNHMRDYQDDSKNIPNWAEGGC